MLAENLDDIIKKYTEELEQMGTVYGGEIEKDVEKAPKTENKEILTDVTTESKKDNNVVNEPETAQKTAKNEELEVDSAEIDTEPAVNEPAPENMQNEASSTADFTAVVFSGEGAYPVEGARIVVYRGDSIYAFLQSDKNGRTKTVKLPAFSEENSLTPDNPESNIDYFADVFAEGFIAQKGLLVSSVGGSEILLKVLLVPEGERVG